MNQAEIDAALALVVADARPATAPAATPARMVVAALKASVGVTMDDLERRMGAKLARDDSRDPRAIALDSKRQAARAALEPRIEPKLLAAMKAHPTPCALFLGPTGCGKTSAARWIMLGCASRMIRSRDLATAFRRHGLGEGYPPEVEQARERGLLVIDDVGSEGADVATLQDILDHRYSRGYPTLVTTGLTDAGLRAHLGAAHYRRVVDQHVLRSDGTEFPVLIVDCHEGEGA